LPPGLTALDAVFKTVYFMEKSMVQLYPSDHPFFMVEEAAEAAAEAAVSRMHSSKTQLAAAAFAVAVAGVAYVATRPRVKNAVAELFRSKPTNAESV
jgi:ribosomal protein L23